jgi:uncharacterized protein with HEPN domain
MSDDGAQARIDNYLTHMLEAAQLARQYVQGVSKDEFLKDRRTQQAVVLNGMRNRMVHGYFDIDLNIVWDTVQSSLPELESQLRKATESEP